MIASQMEITCQGAFDNLLLCGLRQWQCKRSRCLCPCRFGLEVRRYVVNCIACSDQVNVLYRLHSEPTHAAKLVDPTEGVEHRRRVLA